MAELQHCNQASIYRWDESGYHLIMATKPNLLQYLLRILTIFFLILVILPSASQSLAAEVSAPTTASDIRDFKLVREDMGWLLMGQQLYWTNNNGLAWQDITPPLAGDEIMDVFFLDDQNAWAVLNQNATSQFTLANTTNGGAAWNSAKHDFSELEQAPSAVAEVHMGWRDTLNGWLVFKFATGSNFSVGLLYSTQDGGTTWQPHQIPLGEPAYFIDVQNGWVAGGPAGKLYRTQDGAESWQEQAPASNAHYQLPIFVDDTNAMLPVVARDGDSPDAEFFGTEDAGQSWTLAGRVPLEPDTPFDTSLPFSASTLIVPNSNRLVHLVDDQLIESQNADALSSDIVALDMVSAQDGWGKWMTGTCAATGNIGKDLTCARETRLLSTNDGGGHWASIPLPGTGQTSIQDNFSLTRKTDSASVMGILADTDTQAYVGQGFDKCEIPTLAQMQMWWTSSPYNAVNLYIGGSARGCNNLALSASFVSQLNSQGWRFIPTWVGPQANCTGYLSRMSSDSTVSYSQGVAEADAALDTAIFLGLSDADGSGTVIYYDLEAYNTSNATCRNAANSFISGWVAEMRARGNLAGVYGASCASAPTDWASIPNVPDALWIANWYGNAGTVAYLETASVWNAACLSNSLWGNHQRLRQYAGGHNETWGGLTLGIDSNVLDGPLTVKSGTANLSSPSVPLNLNPAQDSTLGRMENTSLTWKTTGDTCSVHIWGGAMDSTVNGNCSLYKLGVRPGGSYSWQVTATNGYGNTLGPVWQFKIKPYGPTNLSVATVFATSVNLSWQLSSDEPANIDGYNIYRDGVKVGSVSQGISSFQVTGLACNTLYSFYITSIRQGVESDSSNSVSTTTTTCAPVLVNPADGFVLENRRPSFEWQAVSEATSYLLQVSSNASFSSLTINTKVLGISYPVTTDLLINKIYYWRVRGLGAFGNGDWSAVRSFKTANPPSRPNISSPADGSLTTNYKPKINWTDSTIPTGTQLDHYQVQLASDSTFSTLLYDQSAILSEFTVPADLSPNSKYFWHVRAFNTLGQYSLWTAVWSFRSAVLPPELISPADGFAFNYLRPTLDWMDASGATKYTVQLSKYEDFRIVLSSKSASLSQYSHTSDLTRNTLLYWRVRTEALNGPSLWSTSWKFTTGNPPGIPTLLTPSNMALITNYQPTLDWADVTLPIGNSVDHYQIQVATDASFSSITLDENVVSSQYVQATPLITNATYYWRVRSFNAMGHYSSWSTSRYFRTAILAPVLTAPGNNASLTSLRPVFGWQSVVGATGYTIQISRYGNFSTNLVNAKILTPTYTPAINLQTGITLYWRVRANGPNGPSLWSPVFQFKIQ